jgi:hypothetical protein
MKLKRFVPNHMTLPRFYGVAWRDYSRDGVVCYPVPVNIVAGLLRGLWHWLKSAGTQTIIDAAYNHGYRDGYNKRVNEKGFEVVQ